MVEERRLVDLEELVARVRVEDVQQRLLVVAARGQRGPLEHLARLAPHDRDVGDVGLVRAPGQQAEQAALADHAALLVEALDPDVVHGHGPVHGGPRVGLRQRQRAGEVRDRADPLRQPRERARPLLPVRRRIPSPVPSTGRSATSSPACMSVYSR